MIYSFGLGEPLMLKLVVPAFSILLASSVPVPAQQTGVCLPALAVSEFIALMKDGEEPSNAFNRSMKQNFDGTERCAEKINAEFKKFDMPSPFEWPLFWLISAGVLWAVEKNFSKQFFNGKFDFYCLDLACSIINVWVLRNISICGWSWNSLKCLKEDDFDEEQFQPLIDWIAKACSCICFSETDSYSEFCSFFALRFSTGCRPSPGQWNSQRWRSAMAQTQSSPDH